MIRDYKKNDLETINKYLSLFGQQGYTENPFTKILIMEENNQIQGFVQYSIMYERAEIEFIYVIPEARRKKIATKLLQKVEQECKLKKSTSITLEVRRTNITAYNLYSSQDYQSINIRKKYYGTEDAIIMEKVIK